MKKYNTHYCDDCGKPIYKTKFDRKEKWGKTEVEFYFNVGITDYKVGHDWEYCIECYNKRKELKK